MHPILSVEFRGGADGDITEESIAFDDVDGFLAFISPGGGCEKIPDGVDELKVIVNRPMADPVDRSLAFQGAYLEMGGVILSGNLQQVTEVAQKLIEFSGSSRMSEAFRNLATGRAKEENRGKR
ncbi:MAG: hypothetical protein KDH88_13965 [Chromatiales bacterium]|nr:hypothetical protein [Chromatiales bacterium]